MSARLVIDERPFTSRAVEQVTRRARVMAALLVIVIAGAALLSWRMRVADPATAPVLTVSAVADTYVDADRPADRHGRDLQMVAGSPHRESFVRFDLAGLEARVMSATFRLHRREGERSGRSVRVTATVATEWSEYDLAGKDLALSKSAAQPVRTAKGRWHEVDVTRVLHSELRPSFSIRSTDPLGTTYDTRETGVTGPQLVVRIDPTTRNPGSTPGTGETADTTWVAAVGDMACAPGRPVKRRTCHQREVSDLLANDPRLAALLALGDLQYESGTFSQFMRVYEPTFGRLKAITRPSPGNHEYRTAGARGYFQYFGDAAGPPGRGYYSFDIGEYWRVIALNSNCGDVSCAKGSKQERWLTADLAAHPKACTLAFWHHPLFSSGRHGDRRQVRPLWDALADANADIVLVGHDHLFERFAPQTAEGVPDPMGVTQFTVGTGGRSLYKVKNATRNSVTRLTDAFGFLRLGLGQGAFSWEFVSESGAVLERGSAPCH